MRLKRLFRGGRLPRGQGHSEEDENDQQDERRRRRQLGAARVPAEPKSSGGNTIQIHGSNIGSVASTPA